MCPQLHSSLPKQVSADPFSPISSISLSGCQAVQMFLCPCRDPHARHDMSISRTRLLIALACALSGGFLDGPCQTDIPLLLRTCMRVTPGSIRGPCQTAAPHQFCFCRGFMRVRQGNDWFKILVRRTTTPSCGTRTRRVQCWESAVHFRDSLKIGSQISDISEHKQPKSCHGQQEGRNLSRKKPIFPRNLENTWFILRRFRNSPPFFALLRSFCQKVQAKDSIIGFANALTSSQSVSLPFQQRRFLGIFQFFDFDRLPSKLAVNLVVPFLSLMSIFLPAFWPSSAQSLVLSTCEA